MTLSPKALRGGTPLSTISCTDVKFLTGIAIVMQRRATETDLYLLNLRKRILAVVFSLFLF